MVLRSRGSAARGSGEGADGVLDVGEVVAAGAAVEFGDPLRGEFDASLLELTGEGLSEFTEAPLVVAVVPLAPLVGVLVAEVGVDLVHGEEGRVAFAKE